MINSPFRLAGEAMPAARYTASPITEDKGRRWSVDFQGERIIDRGQDPEHEACRVLLARGIKGRVSFVHASGTPGMSMDIERGAGLTTFERNIRGLSIGKYWPLCTPIAPPAPVAPFAGTIPHANQSCAACRTMEDAA